MEALTLMSGTVRIRNYTLDDFPGLKQIQRECFPPPFPEDQTWTYEQIASHMQYFPEGCFCAEVNGELVGSCTALIVAYDPDHLDHKWNDVMGGGFLNTHNAHGDSLYGVDMSVRPAWRGRGVAKALYQARFDLVRRLGLKRFMAGGRMPGYHLHAADMTPEQYAEAVAAGKLIDPVITPQLKAGLRPVKVVHDYLVDVESCDCALLLEWLPE
jgi:ribosomal protein S18 acetylase RimI-like enzyme